MWLPTPCIFASIDRHFYTPRCLHRSSPASRFCQSRIAMFRLDEFKWVWQNEWWNSQRANNESIAGSCLLTAAVHTSALHSGSGCTARKASRQRDFKCGHSRNLNLFARHVFLVQSLFALFLHFFPTFLLCSSPATNFKKVTRNFACLTRITTIISVLLQEQAFCENFVVHHWWTIRVSSHSRSQTLPSLPKGSPRWAITPTRTSSTDFSKSVLPSHSDIHQHFSIERSNSTASSACLHCFVCPVSCAQLFNLFMSGWTSIMMAWYLSKSSCGLLRVIFGFCALLNNKHDI